MNGQSNWRTTTFGSAVHDPSNFLKIVLDSVSFAAALFIVASGFALIFGLMRVVNMAHGAFYLLAGYIAYEVQQGMTGQGFSLQSSEVNTWEWLVPLLVAAPCIAVVGYVMQQAFLRWNQGQELRQALITIAVSVIVADQIIAHFPRNVGEGTQKFGGNAVDLTWPGWTDRFVDLHVGGVQYSLAKLVMIGIGIAVGVGLWLWLYKTKTGMVIRAGVDDEQMTSALGINIQKTFAIAFVVGCMLAALGAVVWASQSNISSGQDGQWLLELAGGRDRRRNGLDLRRSRRRDPLRLRRELRRVLPAHDRLRLLHPVLVDPHVRPDRARARVPAARPVREGRVNPRTWTLRQQVERGIAAVALVIVIIWPAAGWSSYWSHTILLETFIFGMAAASLVFLSAYGGMVSLAQTALFGIAGIIFGNMATKGGPGGTSKGLHLGWDPTVALIVAIVLTTMLGLIGGAVASRSAGIYFLMITLTYSVIAVYTLGQVTKISRLLRDRRHQQLHAGLDRRHPRPPEPPVLHRPRRVAFVVTCVIRYIVRTPFGIALQGVRDEPIRAASLGYNVPLHRTLAFGFGAFLAALAGVLYAWFAGQVAPGDVDLPQTINLLIMAVIGGLVRIEGAWVGAFVFFLMQNYITSSTHIPLLGFGGTIFGGSFNTLIGIIFLAIVVVSPDGLHGAVGPALPHTAPTEGGERRGAAPAVEPAN